jgi:hypothetical protein
MGQTWKYKTMFAEFGDLLVDTEIIAVDYDVSDTHESIFKESKELVSTFKPDYLMGYCYGSFVCINSADSDVKGIILLDPSSKIKTLDTSHEDVQTRNLNITEPIPRIPLDKIACKVDVIFTTEGLTGNKTGMQIQHIKNKQIHTIENSTHMIMIEPARYELAKRILEIMNA